MKKTVLPIAAGLLCLQLAGCGSDPIEKEHSREILINIKNDAEDPLSDIGITWYLGQDALGTIGMKNADGSLLGKDSISFCITEEDIPADADLSDFRIKVSVTDADGATFDAYELRCIPEFGKDYSFLLREEDGCYSLWSVLDGNVVGISNGASESTEKQRRKKLKETEKIY